MRRLFEGEGGDPLRGHQAGYGRKADIPSVGGGVGVNSCAFGEGNQGGLMRSGSKGSCGDCHVAKIS